MQSDEDSHHIWVQDEQNRTWNKDFRILFTKYTSSYAPLYFVLHAHLLIKYSRDLFQSLIPIRLECLQTPRVLHQSLELWCRNMCCCQDEYWDEESWAPDHRSQQVRIEGGPPTLSPIKQINLQILPKLARKRKKNAKNRIKIMKRGQNGSKWHVFTIFGRFCYSYDQKMH
jgi:hypothetical protein